MSESTFVSQSSFAGKAQVTRQAVNKAIAAGDIIKTEKGIDPKHPTNKAYMVRALARAAQHPEKIRKPPVAAAAGKKAPAGKTGTKKGGGPKSARKPEQNPKEDEKSKADKVRALLEESGLGEAGFDVDSMVNTILQKSYWDTLKVKEEVLKKQLDRAREVGSVIDQRIIESEIGGFGQAIVANFVDSPQKQAIQICQMLGAEGKERQVTEYLEKDNARRLEECDRAVKKIAGALRHRAGRKRKAAA